MGRTVRQPVGERGFDAVLGTRRGINSDEAQRRRWTELLTEAEPRQGGWPVDHSKQDDSQRIVDALADQHGRRPVQWPEIDRAIFDALPDRWILLLRSPMGRGSHPALEGLGPTGVNTYLMKLGSTHRALARTAEEVLGAKTGTPRYLHTFGHSATETERDFHDAMDIIARIRAGENHP